MPDGRIDTSSKQLVLRKKGSLNLISFNRLARGLKVGRSSCSSMDGSPPF
jgi:hypothetical protein